MLIDMQENIDVTSLIKENYFPKEVLKSGQRDEDKLKDDLDYSKNALFSNPAILVLEDDIINSNGYGLKKGFYNVAPDKYFDFLYIYQSGKLKAKVPVIRLEKFETLNPKQEKPKKMSYRKFLREQEKNFEKSKKGELLENVDYKEVQINYIEDKKAYIIIYNANNVELTGMIKFWFLDQKIDFC